MTNPFIRPEKWAELRNRMRDLGLREEDITEKFVLGSGRGGQKINKTSSSVYLKHEPTGTEVKCQKGRSRDANRFFARRELCEKVEDHVLGKKSVHWQEIEKVRKQKARRKRRSIHKQDPE